MLAIQIAAGIVLAVVVLRFWRQSLWVAGSVLGLGALTFVVLWARESDNWVMPATVVGFFGAFYGLSWLVRRSGVGQHRPKPPTH